MKQKILLILLALCLCVCLAACGDDDDDNGRKKSDSGKKTEASDDGDEDGDPTPTEAAKGITIASTETWGDFTVGIPADWTFRKGDALDEEDTRYCSVKKSDFKFFDFKRETEDLANQHYTYNKNTYTNEQKDVSGTIAGIEWTGFQYSDGWGGYGFELIATVGGKPVRVSSSGFAFDSEEAKAILGSLVVKGE